MILMGMMLGDFVLKELCQVVDNKLKGDVFCKIWRREFDYYFPKFYIQAATSIANRIRKRY